MRGTSLRPDASPVARAVYERMRAKGLNAKALSLRAGLPPGFVRALFRGKLARPNVESLAAIARILECSVEDVTGTVAGPSKSLAEQTSDEAPHVQVAANRNLMFQLLDVLSDREQKVVKFVLDLIGNRASQRRDAAD